MMLEVLRQDYIRTAWAKGLKERAIVLRHAIKNALIPVVTLVGLQLPLVVGGAVIMENLFNLPGLGRLLVDALTERDYPVVSGVNLFFACVVLLNNLFIDLPLCLFGSQDPVSIKGFPECKVSEFPLFFKGGLRPYAEAGICAPPDQIPPGPL